MTKTVTPDSVQQAYNERDQQMNVLQDVLDALDRAYGVMHGNFRQNKIGDAMATVEYVMNDLHRAQLDAKAAYPDVEATQPEETDIFDGAEWHIPGQVDVKIGYLMTAVSSAAVDIFEDEVDDAIDRFLKRIGAR